MSSSLRARAAASAVAVLLGVGGYAAAAAGHTATRAARVAHAARPARAAAVRPAAVTTSALETAPAKKSLSSVTWAIFPYPPSSIDPVKYNDYPEDIIIPNMCESLLRQVPGVKTVPNLAQSWTQPNPLTLVLTIRRGVHFWDGTPMTAADVVYSLERNLQASAQSIYGSVFHNVKSITATGADQVTIKFSAQDVTFLPEMATLAGAVVEPAYVKREGAKFGTPAGGVMCTGPYELKSWNGTSSLVMVANPHYWDAALAPKVKTFTFEWPVDPGQIASGYESGTLDGGFFLSAVDIPPLRNTSAGTLYLGSDAQSMEVMALISVGTSGPIVSPLVRRALFMSINRTGLITAAENGAGTPGFADASPGYFSYAQSQYQAAYTALAKGGYDPTAAEKLVKQAGAAAKGEIVLAIPSGTQEVQDVGEIVQQSAAAVGLHVVLKTVPNEQYGALFSDPAARKGDALIFTINYDQDPDPLAIYDDIALPYGISNFSGYDNSQVTKLLTQARATSNASARAALVIDAQKLVMQDMPWIPLDFRPNTTFVRNGVCGVPLDFSAMSSLWAASVGGC